MQDMTILGKIILLAASFSAVIIYFLTAGSRTGDLLPFDWLLGMIFGLFFWAISTLKVLKGGPKGIFFFLLSGFVLGLVTVALFAIGMEMF